MSRRRLWVYAVALLLGVGALVPWPTWATPQFIVSRIPPPPPPSGAYRRMMQDTSESGTHNSIWRTSGDPLYPRCEIVTSSRDGQPVITGTYQQRCNWNGVDAGAPFGHSHTEQWFAEGDFAWTNEYLVRFRWRNDDNVDHNIGSKMLRPSYPSGGAWVVSCEYENGNTANWVWFEGLISVAYFSPGNSQGNPTVVCGDHIEHDLAYYVYKHASAGIIKFWHDGDLKRTWTGDTSNIELSLYVVSNWSLNPGWDHDDLNNVYVDDWEVYTDATSGGTPASGNLSDNSATVP